MEKVFNTKYNRVQEPPEMIKGVSKTERAGYIPAKTRIENMILAGQRLVEVRKEMYDFYDEPVDVNFDDPTRKRNFDMADATQLRIKAEENLVIQNQVAQMLKEDAKNSSQTAQNGSGEPQNTKEVGTDGNPT